MADFAPPPEPPHGPLPPPWDRIFSLGSRTFVWCLLAGLLYLLRPFFLLVFLTFVFAYIQAHGADGLARRFTSRKLRVVIVFCVLLGSLTTIGQYLIPHIQKQVVTIAESHEGWIRRGDEEIRRFAGEHRLTVPAEFSLGGVVEDLLGLIATEDGDGEGGGEGVAKAEAAEAGRKNVQRILEVMRGTATWVMAIGSAFFLSLLFSFLIVLDLPKLARGIQGLAGTKIGFIYSEVAESVQNFCRTLGRAMEAQLLIAIFNTILTAGGLWAIGLVTESTVFLCTIVFLCSFIPVAGVFVSSTPICIVALSEHGFGMMAAAIAMILVIHFVEAYILNPRIYGHHLRMHPVLTLIVLTVCGKLFGPWGLILGIPVANYVFSEAIRYQRGADAAGASRPVRA